MSAKPVLKRLIGYMKPHMVFFVLALVSAAANVALTLWLPVLIGNAVDCIVGVEQVDFDAMLPILLRMAIAIGGAALFAWLMTMCTNRITFATVRDIRVDAFHSIQDVPLKYIDGHPHGDLISRVINDSDQISDGLLQGFAQLFTGVMTIAGTLFFMLSINVPIALFVVLMTPVSLLVAWFVAKRSYSTFTQQMAERGEIGGYAEEIIAGQPVVKAFGYQKRAEEKFEEINQRLYKSGVKSQFFSSLTNPSTRFISALVYAGVGIGGAFSAIAGGISIGQLSSFLIYANQYMKPFNEISGVITELQSAFASARRVFDMIDEPAQPPDAPDALVMTDSAGNVEMQDVSFSYHPDAKLIEGLNLYAESGERVAIVGPTGSGKTTIINLLMRFYDVDSGKISIDSIDIQSITRDSMRAMYGMVLQETWVFTGSVKQNIAFGRPDATDEEIVAAAKAAGAHSFISRLENGYETVLTEDGGISEGQKQLLCIARVMLNKPPILILDEATSSIDTRTELKIQAAFDKLMENKTSFVVAHRLSTIRSADLILVMDKGHIVEQGTHAELLEKGGFYAKLYNSQFEGN